MNKLIGYVQRTSKLFFLLLGLLVLGLLLFQVDFQVIVKSFRVLGNSIFIVFCVPIVWVILNTLCIATLINYQVTFHHLLYNQLVGDGYNVIIPFAGLGGEPFKIKHLTNWLPLDVASESIMRDRLIHSVSGIIYGCIMLWGVVLFLPLTKQLLITFLIISIILSFVSVLYCLLILSDKPNKYLGKIMKKLGLVNQFTSSTLQRTIFFKALAFKLLGRLSNLLEFLVIFLLLDLAYTLIDLVTVSALLALSGILLFIIPQGIGVNEAGISGAFQLIGQPVAIGLSVGLIRRARVLFWAFLGILLHLLAALPRLLSSLSEGN